MQRKGFQSVELRHLEEATFDGPAQQESASGKKPSKEEDELLEKITDSLVVAFVLVSIFKVFQYLFGYA